MYVDDIAHERHVVARWFFNLGDNHDVSQCVFSQDAVDLGLGGRSLLNQSSDVAWLLLADAFEKVTAV
jgi:hypothetical protein